MASNSASRLGDFTSTAHVDSLQAGEVAAWKFSEGIPIRSVADFFALLRQSYGGAGGSVNLSHSRHFIRLCEFEVSISDDTSLNFGKALLLVHCIICLDSGAVAAVCARRAFSKGNGDGHRPLQEQNCYPFK